jgi:uncharacterized membrane protein
VRAVIIFIFGLISVTIDDSSGPSILTKPFQRLNTMLSPATAYQIGKWLFVVGLLGLAMLGIINQDFVIGRPPEWSWGGREFLPLILNLIVITLCVAIVSNKYPYHAAVALGLLIVLVNFLFRHIPVMVTLDAQGILFSLNAYKTLAFCGGAFFVAVANSGRGAHNVMLTVGCVFFAIFFVTCGFAHFKFDDFVRDFIPAYIPFRPFWTYFCGVTLIAGGLGILVKPVRTPAAFLSAVMVFGWVILLHIPRFFMNMSDPSDRLGLCEATALSGALLTLYSIFRANEGPVSKSV